MRKFYDVPTQVYFVDEEGTWRGGIAYGREIICGCCGGVFSVDGVIEFAPEYVQHPIHEYEHWTDIDEDIRGGKYPKSFVIEPTPFIKATEEDISIGC